MSVLSHVCVGSFDTGMRKGADESNVGLQIALKSNCLDTAYCLLYGDLPSPDQSQTWHSAIMREAHLPLPIVNAIEALPADSHPMSLVMAGIVALGALHPEQNPALAGQSIYQSKEVQDAQIVRLLGKVPAIAAYAYHRYARTLLRPKIHVV
jgi:citrate synthase